MYHLIIDTEQYAGNFERALAVYATAACQTSPDLGASMQYACWWKNHLVRTSDTNDVATIAATPGWFNNGMGSHYPETQDEELLTKAHQDMLKAHQFNSAGHIASVLQRLANNNFELEDKSGAWTFEGCKQTIQSHRQWQEELKKRGLVKHPAYLSVCIVLTQEPPPEVWMEFCRRVHTFAATRPDQKNHKNPLTITRMRLAPVQPAPRAKMR